MKSLIVKAVMVLLMLGFFALAGRVFIAELHARQVAAFLDDWSKRGEIPSENAWDIAINAAKMAVYWYPVAHGEHYERLGRIYEWRHTSLNPGRPEAEESRRLALNAYRQAAITRPLSPYSWSRILQVKMRLLEFDDEFADALRQSVALGPWRPRINVGVVRTGVIAWHQLSAEQRQLVLASAERAALQDTETGRKLLTFSHRFHLSEPFCQAMEKAFDDSLARPPMCPLAE
jgi:hypothetical protein